jgi:DNA-binding CsgD family transcriptional regulator
MQRTEITAAVVDEAEKLLADGMDRAAVASRLGISEYVLGVLAHAHRRGNGRAPAPRRSGRRVPNSQHGIDATTIRMIQRMLAAGILGQVKIARAAGVSPNTVGDVAAGRRKAIRLAKPVLDEGETFLPEPIRCSVCRATISVVPCRACRAIRLKNPV